jgi:hypothetical protein
MVEDVLVFGKQTKCALPYPHFVASPFYTEQFYNSLLVWLEQNDNWRLRTTSFYEQYERVFSLRRPCDGIEALWDGQVLGQIRNRVASAFDSPLSSRISISAHKLVPGQHIGIHTDRTDSETHRLVVQLSRGRSEDSGGNFVVLSGPSANNVERVFNQRPNAAIGFALGEDSYHAVTQVKSGTRFTIIYSFLSDEASDAEYQYFRAC